MVTFNGFTIVSTDSDWFWSQEPEPGELPEYVDYKNPDTWIDEDGNLNCYPYAVIFNGELFGFSSKENRDSWYLGLSGENQK